MSWKESSALYREYMNPDYVDLLESFGYGRCFERASGVRLYDETGADYLDFLAGFGVHNLGHNPARVIDALKRSLECDGPSMLNIDAPLAAARVAERLTQLTHPSLCRTVFASSGAEAAEIAIRAARAATGRTPIVACDRAYHGLTTGAIALSGDGALRAPFGPLLPGVAHVPFGDLEALGRECRDRRPAAFFVEPVQAEGGIRVPGGAYLEQAAAVCRRHGVLLVVDEIQTGMGRAGTLFATPFGSVRPDMLLLGKALGAGLVPVAAAMMTDGVWRRAFAGPSRCLLDTSTCAGGRLAMAAAMAVLDGLTGEGLLERAHAEGARLLERLHELARRHAAIRDVRGRGLLLGVELRPPSVLTAAAVPAWAREGLHAHVICALLLRDHRIVLQPCSLASSVLRIEPPLTVGRADTDRFVDALEATLTACPSYGAALRSAFRKTVLGADL